MRVLLVPVLLVACLVLAGCTGTAKDDGASGVPEPKQVDVTDTTGGIRGVVVDQAIRPLKAAAVSITSASFSKNLTTDEAGGFVLANLKPGTYLVKASKPLYDTQQQSLDVKAGVAPPVTKIQLNQVVFAKPYLETLKFQGFLVCSQDFDGALFSEECGQGVGVPCQVPPPYGCNRLGTQSGNAPEYDFYASADHPQSMIVELTWQPTIGAATTGALWTIVETNFACDPTCSGDAVLPDDFGHCRTSPMYLRNDEAVQKANLTAAIKVSTFTWACGKGGTIPYDLEVNQEYSEYVTMSYVLPLPADWSFVQGSPDPFAGA
jgi:hypothetical protein